MKNEDSREKRTIPIHLKVIVPTGRRVSGGQDRGPRVEHRRDPRLGDGNGLLLHRLVDGHSAPKKDPLRPEVVQRIVFGVAKEASMDQCTDVSMQDSRIVAGVNHAERKGLCMIRMIRSSDVSIQTVRSATTGAGTLRQTVHKQ